MRLAGQQGFHLPYFAGWKGHINTQHVRVALMKLACPGLGRVHLGRVNAMEAQHASRLGPGVARQTTGVCVWISLCISCSRLGLALWDNSDGACGISYRPEH